MSFRVRLALRSKWRRPRVDEKKKKSENENANANEIGITVIVATANGLRVHPSSFSEEGQIVLFA
jgi:hypothetical protein